MSAGPRPHGQWKALDSSGSACVTGAWVSFIAAASGLTADTALTANVWLGFLPLGGSAFIIATDLRKHAGGDDCVPEVAGIGLLLAAIALLGACWSEAVLRTAGGTLANWMVADALFTAMLLYLIGLRMVWPLARGLALAAQIAGAAAVGIVSHMLQRAAIVLGVVVLKLFLVDLASGGSIARVVSFVGVGLLLLVGYFAPYPKTAHGESSPASA